MKKILVKNPATRKDYIRIYKMTPEIIKEAKRIFKKIFPHAHTK